VNTRALTICGVTEIETIIQHAVKTLLPQSTGSLRNVKKLNGGYNSDVYAFTLDSQSRNQKLVLKVYQVSYAIEHALNEYHVLRDLESKGFTSIPKSWPSKYNLYLPDGIFADGKS